MESLTRSLVVPEFLLVGDFLLLHDLFLEERPLFFELILEFLQLVFLFLDGRLVLFEGFLEILGRLLAGAGGEHDLPDIHKSRFLGRRGGRGRKDEGQYRQCPQQSNPYLFIEHFPFPVCVCIIIVKEQPRPSAFFYMNIPIVNSHRLGDSFSFLSRT